MHRAAWLVDGQAQVIDAQPVALGVTIRCNAELQHLVRAVTNTGHNMGGREPRLLNFRKVVFRVAVQLKFTHFNQRIILVRPDLGEIKRIIVRLGRIRLWHDLYAETPFREIASLNRIIKVALVGLAIFTNRFGGVITGLGFDALFGLEVELHPEALILRIDERIGVRAIAVHMPVACRQATV